MASITGRYFFIEEDDTILRVSNAKMDRLLAGNEKDRVERYANQCLRSAEVILELKDRKPYRVLRSCYFLKYFDSNGLPDQEKQMESRRLTAESLPSISPPRSDVIEMGPTFAQKKQDNLFRWQPDAELEKKILDASIGEYPCRNL